MAALTCPHCSADNEMDSAFCASCGKALPSAQPTSPRIIGVVERPSTAPGLALRSDELQRQLKKAAGALLAVAILQCVFGTVLVLASSSLDDTADVPLAATYASVLVLGAVFFALYIWARRNPLPAAICGLVVFVTLHLIDALVDPTTIVRGIIIKVIIIVVLARAISAGVRYRRMQQVLTAVSGAAPPSPA